MNQRIAISDVTLAGIVIIVWGSNFVVMKWGLDRMPALAICAWRFLLSFAPACFFYRFPKGQWRLLISFGGLTGIGQFGLLSIAMQGLISPGLASALVQTQAFFNVGLAALLLNERVKAGQALGCLIAAAGLLVVAFHSDASATAAGILLVLLAALSWASCNVLIRSCAYEGDLVAFMVWMSLFATLPLAALSVVFEGPDRLLLPFSAAGAEIWLIIGWQAYANTIFGYSVWNGLIRRYSLSRIAPLTLLVPLVAMALSALILDEQLPGWKLTAAALILLGVSAPYLMARFGVPGRLPSSSFHGKSRGS